MATDQHSTLYYADNLEILRDMPDTRVDLIYLDPPFSSNKKYSKIHADETGEAAHAQVLAYNDTWRFGEAADEAFRQLMLGTHGGARDVIKAFETILGRSNMLAYLCMMTVRLVELQRVLKPTGSIYLHCDDRASHYLKLTMDAIFGAKNYLNEVTWQRTNSHNDGSRYGRILDKLLFYKNGRRHTWHKQFTAYETKQLKRYEVDPKTGRLWTGQELTAPGRDGIGREPWRGAVPGRKRMWAQSLDVRERLWADGLIATKKDGRTPRLDGHIKFLDEMKGKPLQSLWTDVKPLGKTDRERLGWPTQKPLALLERIIIASSNPGDLVLDPFCGCGTSIHAAQVLGRRWIGIDVTHLAITVIEDRLRGQLPGTQFNIRGVPTTVQDAAALAERDRYEFQYWALSLITGVKIRDVAKKKGGDKGIDGLWTFQTRTNRFGTAVVSVKSDRRLLPVFVRELHGTVQREDADFGVLVTLHEPTKGMVDEARAIGRTDHDEACPKIQLLTIAQLLAGIRPRVSCS